MYTDLSKIWNVTLINSNLLGLQKNRKKQSTLLHAVAMGKKNNKKQQNSNV